MRWLVLVISFVLSLAGTAVGGPALPWTSAPEVGAAITSTAPGMCASGMIQNLTAISGDDTYIFYVGESGRYVAAKYAGDLPSYLWFGVLDETGQLAPVRGEVFDPTRHASPCDWIDAAGA